VFGGHCEGVGFGGEVEVNGECGVGSMEDAIRGGDWD
jgi:hypothetical protein